MRRWIFVYVAMTLVPAFCGAQVITTVAGRRASQQTFPGGLGDGGPAIAADLTSPTAVAFDNLGNLYIADNSGQRIRKVNTAGIISTVAGTGNLGYSGDGGPATSANLYSSWGVTPDGAGNLYIVDRANNRIRKVDALGIITTVAGGGASSSFTNVGDGGPATSAVLRLPQNVILDSAGNLYIADTNNFRVRKVTVATGIITTIAGFGAGNSSGDGGPATAAGMAPTSLAFDSLGNLYIADTNTGRIRKVNPAGVISTVAGGAFGAAPLGDGGPATSARLGNPYGLALDGAGNMYIGDFANNRVRKVDTAGIITTIAGSGLTGNNIGDGGPATSALLLGPAGVAFDAAGNLYIADNGHGAVRKVTFARGLPSISANGVVNAASFQPGMVPNSWGTIQGSNLSSTTNTWDNSIVNGRLPATLDGVTVTVGGKPAYLYYVSPGQINLVVPDIGLGPTQVTVTNAAGTSAAFTVTSSQYGPAFFPWPGGQAVATRQDFSYAARNGTFSGATTIPAKPGDVIILWGTGFGPTTPAAPFGVQVPGDQTYSTATLPAVTINNVNATVFGAALAPGFAGLYQVAIQVPNSLADGDWPVQASIGGVPSPGGTVLSVRR